MTTQTPRTRATTPCMLTRESIRDIVQRNDKTGQWTAQVSLDLGDDVTVTLTRECLDWEAGNKWVGQMRYALERQVSAVVLAKEGAGA